MKIKEGFILKEMAGSWVVVPVGENMVDFQMMMTLNESGAFLWNQLLEEKSEEQLVSALVAEYDIDTETAASDVKEFLQTLAEKSVISA